MGEILQKDGLSRDFLCRLPYDLVFMYKRIDERGISNDSGLTLFPVIPDSSAFAPLDPGIRRHTIQAGSLPDALSV